MDLLAEFAARFGSLEVGVGVAERRCETLEGRVVELETENARLSETEEGRCWRGRA